MKSINESIQKITQESMKSIADVVSRGQSSEKAVLSGLLSITGIDSLLKNLSENELTVLAHVYSGDDGITLIDLEKKTGISVDILDACAASLSQYLLIYTIKNRQLLTNKLDKLYGIEEIGPFINFTDNTEIAAEAGRIRDSLCSPDSGKTPHEPLLKDKKAFQLLTETIKLGGVIPLEKSVELLGAAAESAIQKCINSGILKHCSIITPGYGTYFTVFPEYASELLKKSYKKPSKSSPRIHNRYRILLNLLKAYDSISGNGLFLTKQMNFRKIDIKRIEDSMLRMMRLDGSSVPAEDSALFVLFILSRLQCLKVRKDSASISLRKIRDYFGAPSSLIAEVLAIFDSNDPRNDYFPSPLRIPEMSVIDCSLETAALLRQADPEYLKTAIVSGLTAMQGRKFGETAPHTNLPQQESEDALALLFLLGIIEEEGGQLTLSDIGEMVSSVRNNDSSELKPEEEATDGEQPPSFKKCVYINPDFTLMVPSEELPSDSQFFLLTHTDIENDDVIINCTITRSSVVQAQKRGIPMELFMDSLEKHARNKIPQNLSFLIQEWSRQTIRIDINNTILLRTSHPSFIQDILLSKKKKAIIEQISPNYAIVDRNHLDDIIKIARTGDTVVSLFEGEEDEDD